MLNKETFFAYARKAPFGGRFTQAQMDGTNAILNAWNTLAAPVDDLPKLAYVLATAFHETGGRMEPVREGFASSDAAARKILTRHLYARKDAKTGHAYYGRGYVQLTWAINYKRLGTRLGLPLFTQPDLALEADIAAKILVIGMFEGLFTAKSLRDYFSETSQDPVGARKIINGSDKKDLIAGYYTAFLGALNAADEKTPQPTDVKAVDAAPDAPPLATDKTTIGAVTSFIGASGAGIFASIDNPWALGAVVIVGIGAILFFTGRLELRRKSGA